MSSLKDWRETYKKYFDEFLKLEQPESFSVENNIVKMIYWED